MKKLTNEQIQGILRHSFTFLGGILIVLGYIDDETWQTLSGSAITLVGTIWSIISKSTQ